MFFKVSFCSTRFLFEINVLVPYIESLPRMFYFLQKRRLNWFGTTIVLLMNITFLCHVSCASRVFFLSFPEVSRNVYFKPVPILSAPSTNSASERVR